MKLCAKFPPIAKSELCWQAKKIKMTTVNLDRIGSRTALFVGLPFGTIFSLMVLFISLFPMFDLGLAVIDGRLFWHPIIWGGLIPATFIFLLWTGGGKIKKHLDKKHSIIRTSFLFTLFVNSWLFALILMIFIIGGLFFPLYKEGFSGISLTAIGFTISLYLVSTVFTALTIVLLIVTITKNKIYG